MELEFFEGATTAFYQTLRTLFGPQVFAASEKIGQTVPFTEARQKQSVVSMSPLQILMGKSKKNTNTRETLIHSKKNRGEIADLSRYLEPSLALLYFDALASSRQTNKEVCYKLVDLFRVELVKIRSIIGAARPKLVQPETSDRMTFCLLDFI